MWKLMRSPAALVAGIVLVAGACDEGLTGLNENPNAPTDVGAQFLLPQSIRSAVEQTFGGGMLSHTLIWPQHGVQIQYPDEERGNVRPESMQGFWDGYYSGPLQDVQVVIQKGREAQRPDIEAVGLIWQTYVFHIVTDLWGDVPYSEALQGAEGISTPVYDPQQEIYAGMIQTLKDAVAMLQSGGEGFGPGDILYANNFEKWRLFANSLRLRLAMRMSEVDEATARSEFDAAYSAGVFTSNADNAMLRWTDAPYQNPVFENWQGRDDHGISATMVDTLVSLADPRLALYAEPAAQDGEFRGLHNGVANPPQSIAWYSRIGNFWRADGGATPAALLTYSEVLFLAAEAAERGWIGGNPAQLYEDGIRANMNQYDQWSPANAPSDADIDTYVTQPVIAYDASRALDQIQLQQWIGLYMNGAEAWSNWRRTGVPDLAMGPDLNLSRIPVRFSYPGLEQSLNAANLSDAVNRQGGGLDLVTPVWWQVN
ncbi:MAG: SusD/RagB family nutrient-binding outer membrane lipoprotein [Longimicrobiales bacterium]